MLQCCRIIAMTVAFLQGVGCLSMPWGNWRLFGRKVRVKKKGISKGASCLTKRLHLDPRQTSASLHDFSDAFEVNWPLSPKLIASTHMRGKIHMMERVLQKLATGERINVATFGGSFTHGSGCSDEQGRTSWDCAWSARTERWLRHHFPFATVTWTNLARGGATTSATYLGGIASILKPFTDNNNTLDLIFIDTLVNDANEADLWGVTLELARSKQLSGDEMRDVPYEAFIRSLNALAPTAQLVALQAGCPKCLAAATPRRKLLQHHGIPVIDYAGLVERSNKLNSPSGPDRLWPQQIGENINGAGLYPWKGFKPDIEAKGSFCCVENHPPWIVQQYVADCIGAALLEMLEDACKGNSAMMLEDVGKPVHSYFPNRSLGMFPTCLSLKSYYNARAATGLPEALLQTDRRTSSLPTVVSGDWRLHADVPGKPGWIATQPNSTIIFPVKLGRYPTVTLIILKSYAGMGAADVAVYPEGGVASEGSVRLTGIWADHSSQFMPEFLSFSDSAEYCKDRGDSAEYCKDRGALQYDPKSSNDNYLLEVRLPQDQPPGLKFKIVLVSSC
jgi:hypothetical protein